MATTRIDEKQIVGDPQLKAEAICRDILVLKKIYHSYTAPLLKDDLYSTASAFKKEDWQHQLERFLADEKTQAILLRWKQNNILKSLSSKQDPAKSQAGKIYLQAHFDKFKRPVFYHLYFKHDNKCYELTIDLKHMKMEYQRIKKDPLSRIHDAALKLALQNLVLDITKHSGYEGYKLIDAFNIKWKQMLSVQMTSDSERTYIHLENVNDTMKMKIPLEILQPGVSLVNNHHSLWTLCEKNPGTSIVVAAGIAALVTYNALKPQN